MEFYTFYNFNSFLKDNAAINCSTVRHKNGNFRQRCRVTLIDITMLL
jgi:hypothetical protein